MKFKLNKTLFVIADSYPPYWAPMNNSDTFVQAVQPGTEMWTNINDLMNGTISKTGHGNLFGLVPEKLCDPKRFNITAIQQIQNPDLWARYVLQKQAVRDKHMNAVMELPCSLILARRPLLTTLLDASVNEYYFFHGTNLNVVNGIVHGGLDERAASGTGCYGNV